MNEGIDDEQKYILKDIYLIKRRRKRMNEGMDDDILKDIYLQL